MKRTIRTGKLYGCEELVEQPLTVWQLVPNPWWGHLFRYLAPKHWKRWVSKYVTPALREAWLST